MEITQNSLSDVLKGRAAMYSYLSSVYIDAMTDDTVEHTKKMLPALEAFAISQEDTELSEAVTDIKSQVQNMTTDAMTKYKGIYASHFLLGTYSTPPNESVYLNKAYKQEPWEKIRRIYREQKHILSKKCKKMEDHISIEFLLMEKYTNDAIAALADDDETNFVKSMDHSAKFMNEHITKWVPMCCSDIIGKEVNPGLSFYQSVSHVAKKFVEFDAEFLSWFIES